MCYYTSVKTSGKAIGKALAAPFSAADDFKPITRANGFAHPQLPVLSMDSGIRSIQLFTWGLIPFWVKDRPSAFKLWNQTLNARSEEVFSKPSFRDSIQQTKGNGGVARRCVIPVTGFFEWKHVGDLKIPYYIHPKKQEFFYLAGIYSHWTDPAGGDKVTTFSILTTSAKANELMSDIHNSAKRMPLMLDEGLINAWIDPELSKPAITDIMQPCPDDNMAAYTVTDRLAKPGTDSYDETLTDEKIYV